MSFFKRYFGPSTLVTAAFIGPGTLTVCTLSGAKFEYSLLWVLLFAVIATIGLQEMAARLGLITQKGLGEAIHDQIKHPLVRFLSITLVFAAIIIGNAAYEAGNISGAVLGIKGVFGGNMSWAFVIGLFAFVILLFGSVRVVEQLLIGLVILMSFVFIVTAVLIKPDFSKMLSGMFIPSLSASNQLSALALIGTTIVPYNLFLHASAVSRKWKDQKKLGALRKENMVAISIGGLISISIVITSAASLYGSQDISGLADMSIQLEPLLGSWAKYFLALGLFAAGISSAITAPLAAAYAAKGIFGWKEDNRSWKFRSVWMAILAIGVVFSVIGYRPIEVIQLAQIANGFLLPVIIFFLVYLSNKKSLLGAYINRPWQNLFALLIILVGLIISFKSFNGVFNLI
ncbi:MAG: Nramp family divalent metal transporter [Bacteroidota bacterium]